MFRIDFIGLTLLIALGAGLFLLNKRHHFFSHHREAFKYPTLSFLTQRQKTWREKFSASPYFLWITGMACFSLAFINPHLEIVDNTQLTSPSEGVAIYLLLDRSSSMHKVIEQEVRNQTWHSITTFERMQEAAKNFINQAPNDLIGLIAFARSAKILSPLTLNHALLKDRIDQLTAVKDQAQDGTAMGYAIYKTAHLMSDLQTSKIQDVFPYQIKSTAMIIITDGLQDPNKLDRENPLRSMDLTEAAEYAHNKGMHVYIVNVNKRFNDAVFTPNRHEMERVAKITGGQLIILKHLSELQKALSQIQKLEKSKIYEGSAFSIKKILLYPYLIGLGLVLIALGMMLNATLFRKII